MEMRISDLLLGLCIGHYLPFTFVAFGLTVHWALVGLCTFWLLRLTKKLGKFLWKKLIKAIKDELEK